MPGLARQNNSEKGNPQSGSEDLHLQRRLAGN